MAPPMVLLKRKVDFSHDEAVSGGESIRYPPMQTHDEAVSGGESIRYPRIRGEERRRLLIKADVVLRYMRTFKAQAVVACPPEISYLNILVPPESVPLQPPFMDLDSGRLSSADKNLVALYAGAYRPGSISNMLAAGGYLIYDARDNSLSAIPHLPDDHLHMYTGHRSAVVMCNGDDGSYVLADLVRLRPGFSHAGFWLWKSSAPGSGWALQSARLHLQPTFSTHLCFSYRGSVLCWVDLLGGMVVCDLGKDCNNPEPQLRFIPLPLCCPSYDGPMSGDGAGNRYQHLSVEEFRTMACVGDTIKFVCMDGNVEQVPGQGFDLTVYALSPDLSEWTIDRKYNVGNIWANEVYHSTGMPKLAPSYPVLSIKEDGVIYLVFTHLRVMDDTSHGTRQRQVQCNSQYMIRVDMKNNKVQLYPQSTESRIRSQFLASEISGYQKRLQDHPREMEARELGASGKKIKL